MIIKLAKRGLNKLKKKKRKEKINVNAKESL